MIARGLRRDYQLSGDLLVRPPASEQDEHLDLAGGQAGQGFPAPRHRLNRLNRLVVCCDCNRPTLASIRAAGFAVAQVEHTVLPKAPPFVRPAILGSATAPQAVIQPAGDASAAG